MDVIKAAWNGVSYVCYEHPELALTFAGGIGAKMGFDLLFQKLSTTKDPLAMIETLMSWLKTIKETLDDVVAKISSRMTGRSKNASRGYMEGLGQLPDPEDMDTRYQTVLTYVIGVKTLALRMTWRDDKGKKQEIFASIENAKKACKTLNDTVTWYSKTVQDSLWPCPNGATLVMQLSKTSISCTRPLPPP